MRRPRHRSHLPFEFLAVLPEDQFLLVQYLPYALRISFLTPLNCAFRLMGGMFISAASFRHGM